MMAADAGVAGLLYDNRLDIVELAKGTVRSTIKLNPLEREKAYLSASGARVVIVGKTALRIVDAAGAVQRTWPRASTDSITVALSPNGSRFAAIGRNRTGLYDVAKQEIKELATADGALAFMTDDLLLHTDDKGFLSVADLRVADGHSGNLLDSDLRKDLFASLETAKTFRGASFSSDATLAFIGGRSPAVVDLKLHRSVTLAGFPTAYGAARFSPNGKVLAVASSVVPEITLFDTQSGRPLGIIQLVGASGAYFQGASGNVEVFGDGAKTLSCIFSPRLESMDMCEDRYFEPGLLARTLGGRGQTIEDIATATP